MPAYITGIGITGGPASRGFVYPPPPLFAPPFPPGSFYKRSPNLYLRFKDSNDTTIFQNEAYQPYGVDDPPSYLDTSVEYFREKSVYVNGSQNHDLTYNTKKIYGEYYTLLTHSNATNTTVSVSLPVFSFFPAYEPVFSNPLSFAYGLTVAFYYNTVGYYTADGISVSHNMATAGTVVFKSTNTGVWSRQTIIRYHGYNSDATNFPTSKTDWLIENSYPTLKHTSRTSQSSSADTYIRTNFCLAMVY